MNQKVLKLNNPNSYYKHREALVRLGLEDPMSDKDERYNKIWNYIVSNNLSIKIVSNYDFTRLAPRTDDKFKFFQARVNSEKASKVQEMYEMFYELDQPMKRVIIGFEIDDELFVSVGNHRSRAHRRAQINYDKESKGHVIVLGDGLTEAQKKLHGLALAGLSNYESDDDIDRETEEDIRHQLQCAWEIQQDLDPSSINWDEEHQIEWGKEWVVNMKPKYKLPSRGMKVSLSRIVNSLFASHIEQTLPFPDTADLDLHFQGFWPRSSWDPDTSGQIRQERFPTHSQMMDTKLREIWWKRPVASQVRDKVWIAARCGETLNANITSIDNIAKKRKRFVINCTKSNKNVNAVAGGYPLVERIIFVQQTHGDNYEAWEWNYQTEEYDQIFKD